MEQNEIGNKQKHLNRIDNKSLGAGKPYLECFPLLLTAEKL